MGMERDWPRNTAARMFMIAGLILIFVNSRDEETASA
jgi:hypothetical protein